MFLGVIMTVLNWLTQLWNEWGFQVTVISSLGANLLLGLLSGTRRRSASGSGFQWPAVTKLALWLAYQVAEVATTSAIGNLSLCGSDASVEEQQLVAFWAPFLLLHMGGPDNMTAYALEDTKLSMRKWAEMIMHIAGVSYTINKNRISGHSRVLFAASLTMSLVGVTRYAEKAYALRLASLDRMQKQESSKKKKKKKTDHPAGDDDGGDAISSAEKSVRYTIHRGRLDRGGKLDDDEALLLAQDLFPVTRRRALVDSSVRRNSSEQRTSEMIFELGPENWKSLCAVVEMELSLIYDVLYTKATVAHTWCGYFLRFASPAASAAAASLFWVWLQDEHGDPRTRTAARGRFVAVTYLLVAATFAMDVVWLLRALGSTSTYAFLKQRPQWAWLHHTLLCAGWWRWLHRVVVGMDPLRLIGREPISYRRWSGTIGQYNLLEECATPRSSWRRWLAINVGVSLDGAYYKVIPENVKRLLVQRVLQILPPSDASKPGAYYTMVAITKFWGQEALRRRRREGELFERRVDDSAGQPKSDKEFEEGLPKFGKEFEEDVIAWHIATCIFLLRPKVKKLVAKSSSLTHQVEAIEAMSEYLMFLVAERREMLPGLILHFLLEETRRTLDELWTTREDKGAAAEQQELVKILRSKNLDADFLARAKFDDGKRLVFDATDIACALTKFGKDREAEMLEFIFEVWVDKLLYASVRCSRERHAQQLASGGELTTVLWIIVQHAGPFRIGEEKPETTDKSEEKKAKDERPIPAPPQPPPPKEVPMAPSPWPSLPPPPLPLEGKPMTPPRPPQKPMAPPPPPMLWEEDPLDALEYKKPIKYVTLY